MSETHRKNTVLARKLIRQKALCAVLDISTSGLRNLRKSDPSFPKPIRYGANHQASTYFAVDEIDEWINSKKESRAIKETTNQ